MNLLAFESPLLAGEMPHLLLLVKIL